jgi:hypothetical protein
LIVQIRAINHNKFSDSISRFHTLASYINQTTALDRSIRCWQFISLLVAIKNNCLSMTARLFPWWRRFVIRVDHLAALPWFPLMLLFLQHKQVGDNDAREQRHNINAQSQSKTKLHCYILAGRHT